MTSKDALRQIMMLRGVSQSKLARLMHTTGTNIASKLNNSSSLSVEWWIEAADQMDFEVVLKPKAGTTKPGMACEIKVGDSYENVELHNMFKGDEPEEPEKKPRAPKGSVNAPRGYDFFGLKDD